MMMRELRNVIVLNFYQFVLITEKWEVRKPLKGMEHRSCALAAVIK